MRIRDHAVVWENPAPAFATEVYSGTALTIFTEGDAEVAVCGFRLGSAKVSPDGRVSLRESRDGGATWARVHSPLDRQEAEAIAPANGLRQLAGPHLGSSPEGTVILGAALMTLAQPDSAEYRPQAAGIVDAECVLVRRSEYGWDSPQVIDARRSASEWSITCGPPVALGDGRWLAPAERHASSDEDEWLRRYNAFSLVSTDDGVTWSDHGEMLNDPERIRVFYDQHVVVLGDRRLLSVAWTHDVVEDRTITAHAAISDDEGASWSEPWDTGVLGGPVGVVRLPDGRLFATYPRRQEPSGIRACLSLDEGRTWETQEEFVIWDHATRSVAGILAADSTVEDLPPLWDTMWGWTFGLPTPAVYADGSVGVVFYASGTDGLSRVIHVRVEP